jgi:hypothetical protein
MSGTTINGSDCKVEISGVAIAGMGKWKYTPGATNELDDSEFGDTTEKIILGTRKRGTISFDGLAKIANVQQETLKRAAINGVQITSMALRMASSRALVPNQTTGYHSPLSTTGNSTQLSYVNITGFDIGSDKSGLSTISFSGVVSGDMVEAAI